MIKKVRNNANPSNTWLGGEDCVPNANLSSDKTMMIRVKLDIISTTAGKNVNEVNNSSVCKFNVYAVLPPAPGELVNAGKPDFCANAGSAMQLARKNSILSALNLVFLMASVRLLGIVFLNTLVKLHSKCLSGWAILCFVGSARCRFVHCMQLVDAT